MQVFHFIVLGFPFSLVGFGSVMGMWTILASASKRLPMPTVDHFRYGLGWALMSGIVCSQILYLTYKAALIYPMSLWYFGAIAIASAFASVAGACYSHNVR
ncbi:MAG: hypothetical protein AB7W16_23780 [Candidatus Obscuribacterales bacterium]